MLLYFDVFYRQFGVRRLSQFLSPRLMMLRDLPRDSVVHYLSEDTSINDIDVSKPYYGPGVKKIFVDVPEQLADRQGGAHRNAQLIRPKLKDFFVKNKKFQFLPHALSKVNDQTAIISLNYSYLDDIYTYPDMPMKKWFQYYNNYRTIFKNISDISDGKIKNHFVFIDLPKELPSRTLLEMFTNKVTASMLKIFPDNGSRFILQFWQWLGDTNRENTIFGHLKPEHFNKTNLVFTSNDSRSVVVNLGFVDSWLKDHEALVKTDERKHLKPDEMQKLFLRFTMLLTSLSPDEQIADETAEVTGEEPAQVIDHVEEDEEDDDDDISSGDSSDLLISGFRPVTKKAPNGKVQDKLVSLNADTDAGLTSVNAVLNRFSDIDKELDILEKMNAKKMKEHGIHLDENGNEIESESVIEDMPFEVLHNKVYQEEDYEQSLLRQINEHADYGLISAADFKKLLGDIEKYKTSQDPYGSNLPTVNAMKIDPQDIVLDKEMSRIVTSDNLIDKSMGESSLLAFDRQYIKNVAKKDMLAMVGHIQKAGFILRRHEIELEHSALGTYENHEIEIKPIDGQPSTLRFRLPVVNEDGTFMAAASKYNMRKQRIDVPIRKINPHTVALTSYYGKTFVQMNQKKVNNSLAWIVKQMNIASMESGHPYIKRVAPANVFDHNFKAPYIFNAMANHFKTISTVRYHLDFDHSSFKETVFPKTVEDLIAKGSVPVGYSVKKEILLVNQHNVFSAFGQDGLVEIGNIYHVLDLPEQDAPLDFVEVKVFSKAVPVGVLLGYILGFNNLLKFLKAKYEVMEGRGVKTLLPHQYVIRFKDVRYILDRRQGTAALILAGFTDFEKQLRLYDAAEFNKKDVYLNLLESKGLSSIYIREIELVQQLFVDTITKSILEQMGEPTTFNGLLVRSTEMLQTYHHPASSDMRFMRIRGYERFAGAVYKALATQVRSYKNRNYAGKSRVEMSPYQVWQSIMGDASLKLVEDINPIQNLKESEIVTYVGEGGRSKDAISKETREYHESDMGVGSEANVDSSDVGVNAYLTFNPNFSDVRGLVKEKKELTTASMLSSSALLSPGAMHDDPKRTNYISIQLGHNVSAFGYRQSYVRTGFDEVISNRTSDLFACTAKADGKVIEINEQGIVVQYVDGTTKGVNLGRQYGKAEGSIYPHDIVTPMKVGQSFKKGDPIAYNTGFFEPSFLDPSRILMKNSTVANFALMELTQTHEDASIISKELGERLTTRTIKLRSFSIDFEQNLLNVVKVGQTVDPRTVLMIIADEITSTSDVFDQQSLETLQRLSNQAPLSQYLGKIDRIEVFYHGDKKDMSSSLRAIADRSDKYMIDNCKAAGKPPINGEVNDDYRVAGTPLALDKAEVKIYIAVETSNGVGDKLVLAHQAKSVVGEVMDYTMHTESGMKIDGVFSFARIAARIIESPILIGTTIPLLKTVAANAVTIYRK